MDKFNFSWQYKEFEIRTQHHLLDEDNKKPYVELIKWSEDNKGKRFCFVLAYYKWDKEGGELIFVGNRPFTEIGSLDIAPIWKQLWLANEMLLDWYEKERGI